MSDPGPFGGSDPPDPFRGMPLFGDLARMLGQQGAMSWDAARQLAISIASGGRSEPNVDPLERIKLEQLARVAELQVANATGLATSTTGRGVTVGPVTRSMWVQHTLDAYRPLFERLADSLAQAHGEPGEPGGPDEDALASADPSSAWLENLMKMLAPMMLGMTAGSLVGHLATRSLGQYDLPIPRPPDDELLVVVANVAEFGDQWSLPGDDLRLWVCLHELTHHAVLGVPHVRARLEAMLGEYVSGFEAQPDGLEERMGGLDPTDPESLQGLLGDPEVLLGAIQSPAQRELLPRLEALVAVVVGYVDHIMDRIGEHLIGSYAMVTEALRRRRVEAAPSDRFTERLLGLDLTQEHYERGAAFVDGVLERAGSDALARLWEAERLLPTPAEIDAPGLWLARIEFDPDDPDQADEA